MKELFFLIPIGLVAYVIFNTTSNANDAILVGDSTPSFHLSLDDWKKSPFETIENYTILGGNKKTKRHSK
jgi:hypothetical protein